MINTTWCTKSLPSHHLLLSWVPALYMRKDHRHASAALFNSDVACRGRCKRLRSPPCTPRHRGAALQCRGPSLVSSMRLHRASAPAKARAVRRLITCGLRVGVVRSTPMRGKLSHRESIPALRFRRGGSRRAGWVVNPLTAAARDHRPGRAVQAAASVTSIRRTPPLCPLLQTRGHVFVKTRQAPARASPKCGFRPPPCSATWLLLDPDGERLVFGMRAHPDSAALLTRADDLEADRVRGPPAKCKRRIAWQSNFIRRWYTAEQ